MVRVMPSRPHWARTSLLSVHPVVGGAALLCLLSACGIAVSVLLTLLKFQSAHECDVAILSACQLGGAFSCGRVLSSGWATVFNGVPISIPATAYYAVVLGLSASMLWRSPRYAAVARPLLLWLAWAGLGVVALLFLYATFVVGGLCSYCLIVYGVTIAIFLIVWWMHPEGHRAGLRGLFSGGPQQYASTLGFVALSLVALVLTQALAYKLRAAASGPKPSCMADGELPATRIQLGPAAAAGEIALFVDLACPACAHEFEQWRREVQEAGLDYRLSIYHLAREGECLPPGATVMSATAMANSSCRAARAVECFERLRPGSGIELVGRLFAAQREVPEPLFTRERLVALAGEVGLSAADEPAFQRCFEHDEEVAAHIRQHTRFADEQGLTETPVAYFTFYDDSGAQLRPMVRDVGAKDHTDRAQYLARARARIEE